NSLVDTPTIYSFFTDLLKTYSQKFAQSKSLNLSPLPLKFESFYSDPQTGNGYGAMGRCFPETIIYPTKQKQINLEINQLYLLNKFGHDKYFASYPQGDYFYLDISFEKMLKTCSHELAHYFQLVKHEKTSCESDLKLGNGKYDEELAKEQKE